MRLLLAILLILGLSASAWGQCVAIDSSKRFIDTDCDGVKDTGELYQDDVATHRAAEIILLDPDIADEIVFRLPPWAGTMTRIDCEAFGGTSVVINICDGEDTGDDTCTTSIPGATMTCTTSGANDTTLSAADFAARDKLTLVLTTETGTVDSLEVYITATVN